MKPINMAEEGCNPISSNCVIWQGPDLGCIKLCKGDNVSTVIYGLATELCGLMDKFNIDNYDLSCFDEGACSVEDFQELIQLLITKVCELTNKEGGSIDPGCPDCEVEVCSAFQVTTPQGDVITTMQLTDYTRAIGDRVCMIIGQIETLKSTVENHEERIVILEERTTAEKSIKWPTMTPACVIERENVPFLEVLVALEASYCEYLTYTGSAVEILSSFNQICVNEYTTLLSNPEEILADRGWSNTSNLANQFGNTWRVLCDIRQAIITLQAAEPSGCDCNNCSDEGVDGDTCIDGNEYYIHEEGKWTLVPNVKFKTVWEQIFYTATKSITEYPGELIFSLGEQMDTTQLTERLKFTAVDLYTLEDGVKILIESNKQYANLGELQGDLNLIGDIATGYWQKDVFAVFKEIIKTDWTPSVTYSNAIYMHAKGRQNMTKASKMYDGERKIVRGIRHAFEAYYTNLNGIDLPNRLGEHFMDLFHTISVPGATSNFFGFSKNLKTFYNQPASDAYIQADGGTRVIITPLGGEGTNSGDFQIVGDPLAVGTKIGSQIIEIFEPGAHDEFIFPMCYAENYSYFLVYPLRGDSLTTEDEYAFYIKPYGVDRASVKLGAANNDNFEIFESITSDKIKRKTYRKQRTDDSGYSKKFSIFENITDLFKNRGNRSHRVKQIHVFAHDIKLKLRSNDSESSVIYTRGTNNSGSYAPRRS